MKPTWELVIEDMKKRNQTGFKRYGKYLFPFNGRNSLQDAFEECLDLCVYLKNKIIESEEKCQSKN